MKTNGQKYGLTLNFIRKLKEQFATLSQKMTKKCNWYWNLL